MKFDLGKNSNQCLVVLLLLCLWWAIWCVVFLMFYEHKFRYENLFISINLFVDFLSWICYVLRLLFFIIQSVLKSWKEHHHWPFCQFIPNFPVTFRQKSSRKLPTAFENASLLPTLRKHHWQVITIEIWRSYFAILVELARILKTIQLHGNSIYFWSIDA